MNVHDRTESTCRHCFEPIKDIGVNYWLHDADKDHEAEPINDHYDHNLDAGGWTYCRQCGAQLVADVGRYAYCVAATCPDRGVMLLIHSDGSRQRVGRAHEVS